MLRRLGTIASPQRGLRYPSSSIIAPRRLLAGIRSHTYAGATLATLGSQGTAPRSELTCTAHGSSPSCGGETFSSERKCTSSTLNRDLAAFGAAQRKSLCTTNVPVAPPLMPPPSSSANMFSSSASLHYQDRSFATRTPARLVGSNFVTAPPLVAAAGHSLHETAREALNKQRDKTKRGTNEKESSSLDQKTHSSSSHRDEYQQFIGAKAFASRLLARYLTMCRTQPLMTVAATSFVLWGMGDLTTQMLERGIAQAALRKEARELPLGTTQTIKEGGVRGLDYSRLAATLVFGTVIAGVAGHHWYRLLDNIVLTRLKLVEGSAKLIVTKLFFECAVWHPIGLSLFWAFQGVGVEGKTLSEVREQLSYDLLPALGVEVALWTPIDIINFRYTPVHLQVIVVNFVSFFEAIVLSYLHSALSEESRGDSSVVAPALMEA